MKPASTPDGSARAPVRAFAHVHTWVFDLDNTLYPHHLNLWQQVDARIRSYISGFLKVSEDEAFRLQKDYYKRYGTTDLFAALNVATGQVIGKCYRRHRQQEFLKFLEEIDAQVEREPGVEIHLVLDNYGTHKTAAVKRWFLRHPEYRLHFTPTSSSWLNQVERFFAEITRNRIRRGAFKSVAELKSAIMAYLENHNADPKPFIWTKSAGQILEKVARAKQALESQH